MARKAVPQLDRLKDAVLELDPEDQETFFEWSENVRDVREADRKAAEARAKRKAATSGE